MPHTPPSPQPNSRPLLAARPATEPNSRYLSPIQEQRILSWRNHAGSPSASTAPKVKSAPASLSLSQAASSSTTCPTCSCAYGPNDPCSCSTKSPKSSSKHHKSYYSTKKKRSGTTMTSGHSAMTPLTPALPVTPVTPARPDRKGLPSAQQVMAHHAGEAPIPQYGPAPSVPLPEPVLAAPPVKPDLPRIAGARDPVTQN